MVKRKVSTDRNRRKKMTLKPAKTSGPLKEPRVQLHVPREETFPIPLKYSDVTRVHTNLRVLQENSTDDFWNVDANRSLSDSWTGSRSSHY